ncbi:MAG TPA: Rieske (2Fe-2S) protein, partial [Thermoanaerobaculia bacterium]|nr:Rieske (2Fe-2S) protein [Thermoanaerobaculia bacterium]
MTLEKSLPSEYYLSTSIFERERERIFSREWFCAGRADTLPGEGAVKVLDLLGESVLVARTREGRLKAHYNVCRHRGARLCTADTVAATIRCPYHAWTYGLDGKLLGAPFLNQDPSLREEDFSL